MTKLKKGEGLETMVKKLTEDEKQLLKVIRRKQLTVAEATSVLNHVKDLNKAKYYPKKIKFNENKVVIGVISDLHMGHTHYRPDILRHAVQDFKDKKVNLVINAGDTLEGMSNREGHIYELTHIGASKQLKYFEKEMALLKDWNVYSIEAQDSHGGWFHNKGNMGLNIGEELHRRANNYVFLGYDEQDVTIGDQIKIRIRHPGGGTAYAVSYKMQKYVESLNPDDRPNIIIQGHFHKSMYMNYRGIHCFDAGSMQDQSPFMKKIGTPSHVGYWILTVYNDKRNNMPRVTSEWVGFGDRNDKTDED